LVARADSFQSMLNSLYHIVSYKTSGDKCSKDDEPFDLNSRKPQLCCVTHVQHRSAVTKKQFSWS